ncbi:Na+/H+ antiporter subunit E [Thalassoglobus polymorphus]|uniref:Na(+)/H(+) antiporter subunit E n=1 Tax=Thalassoglobus polymorphus TaxID=2527994 RepID=A0A517QRA5_9PLAN|nr:Na+/H+ antiporter subunit E [Thalassoglobus polymorphus]QDT34160.1 Na(+)/H(+) antiporter subunit E [Thalassoglobus polymorphus]
MLNFFFNIFLALVWALANGQISLPSLSIGFVLGYCVLWFSQPLMGQSRYFRRLPIAIRFAGFFLWQLILSNLRVAYDVITPHLYMRPGIIAVPLDAKTDREITLLANLITLTPGTLSLDVSDDKRTLYVHAMFVDSPESVRDSIKNGFERRLLELIR